ncbi:MAG TPA: FAD binding domain-containing protein [Actinocrinis sp.]|uniref:FAD binding domain-containing protein n=1 Tax=Actinocrinis sp. TaxID=1920516 RepID=UPI002DDC94F9|nr:FAD binding domain-containing protein [Actinocrinis sp.]HEV2342912.1 FAD binding domain-containing protein [Actinocrinis sp.]
MHPARFAYARPADLAEALDRLAGSAAPAVLAGGLDLVPALRARKARPDTVVDISAIPGLDYASLRDGSLVAGATARQDQVLRLAEAHPGFALLAAAMRTMGTAQVRRTGTVVGTVMQADPALQLAAVCGVLDAIVELRGPEGTRRLAAASLFAGTRLPHGTLAVEIALRPMAEREGWAFARAGLREIGGHLGGVAARLSFGADGRHVADAVVAPFVAGHDGSPLGPVGAALAGRPLDPDTLRDAEAAARAAVRTTGDNLSSADYRRHLVGVLTRRALAEAAGRARRNPDV